MFKLTEIWTSNLNVYSITIHFQKGIIFCNIFYFSVVNRALKSLSVWTICDSFETVKPVLYRFFSSDLKVLLLFLSCHAHAFGVDVVRLMVYFCSFFCRLANPFSLLSLFMTSSSSCSFTIPHILSSCFFIFLFYILILSFISIPWCHLSVCLSPRVISRVVLLFLNISSFTRSLLPSCPHVTPSLWPSPPPLAARPSPRPGGRAPSDPPPSVSAAPQQIGGMVWDFLGKWVLCPGTTARLHLSVGICHAFCARCFDDSLLHDCLCSTGFSNNNALDHFMQYYENVCKNQWIYRLKTKVCVKCCGCCLLCMLKCVALF